MENKMRPLYDNKKMNDTMLYMGVGIVIVLTAGGCYGMYLGINAYLNSTTSIFSWIDLVAGAAVVSILMIATQQQISRENKAQAKLKGES